MYIMLQVTVVLLLMSKSMHPVLHFYLLTKFISVSAEAEPLLPMFFIPASYHVLRNIFRYLQIFRGKKGVVPS